ncbi:MAG: hypothetical protein NUW37_20280 [Planctomycetes bacterium]|nr:hypothetical protein [Planctomycetota bacterium]
MDTEKIFSAFGKIVRIDSHLSFLADDATTIDIDGGGTFTNFDGLLEGARTLLDEDELERERLTEIANLLGRTKDQIAQARSELHSVARRFFESSVKDEISSTAEVAESVARDLGAQMRSDGESLLRNEVGIVSQSAGSANCGNGALLVTLLTASGPGVSISDERTRSNFYKIVCDDDSYLGSSDEGEERFILRGAGGSSVEIGVVPGVNGSEADQVNRVRNGLFEVYSGGGNFDQWTTVSGAAKISQGSDAAAYLGSGCLIFTGDGATYGEMTQSLATLDPPLKMESVYGLHVSLRASGVSAGNIAIDVRGTGFTSAESIFASAADLSSSYGSFTTGVLLPRDIPEDIKISMRFSSGIDGAVFVDHLALAEVAGIDDDGVKVALFAGNKNFRAGVTADSFTILTSSTDAGLFQTFMRDVFKVALPSTDAGTIDEAFAQ